MKRAILFFLTIVTIIACASKKDISKKNCSRIYRNDFRNIAIDTFKTTVNGATLNYNIVSFQCVYSAMYTQKVMYDKYGKWNKIIFTQNGTDLFIWEKINLFENDSQAFTVIASGRESSDITYVSIMIFDEHTNDMLSVSSPYREQLINYFSDAIRSNDENKTDFYEVYWTTIDPAHWEYLKKIKKEKKNTVNQGGDPKLRYLNLKKN
jgi:hypothetical protein